MKLLSKWMLSAIAFPLLAGVAMAAEEFQMRWKGHLITVQVISYDPECGHKLLIVESTEGSEIGTYITVTTLP